MTVRSFAIRATAVVLSAYAASAAHAQTQTLKFSTAVAAGHPIVKFGIAPWMACVKEQTKGAVDFNFFPGGQIANNNNAVDAINKGLVEMAMIAISNATDKLPLAGITMLPDMGDTSLEMTKTFRKVLDAGGPLSDELSAAKLKAAWVGMLPAYQLVTKGAPIQTLDQIKGKKLRVTGGLMGLTVRAIGSVAVDIPAGDAYMAVQQGTVDGAVFALSSVQSYKLQEVAKSMSGNGSFGTGPIVFGMDLGVWDKLGAEKQAAFKTCGAKYETDMHVALDAENEQLKKDFTAAGVTIYNFSPEVKAELAKRLEGVNKEYVTRLAARGLKAQEVYDSYRKALGR